MPTDSTVRMPEVMPALKLEPGKLSLRSALAIVLFAVIMLVPSTLQRVRPLSDHEVLAALPAREMLQTGQWLIPKYLGVTRHEKPPGAPWLIAVSMGVFHSDAAWVVRSPSTLSAMGCALIVAMLAARWYGNLCGLLAGLMQLSSVWIITQAHLAQADMPLTFCVTMALGSFALAQVSHPAGVVNSRWLRWGFFAATGYAFLLKGPAPLLLIFLGCLTWLVVQRQWRGARFLADPVGLIILLVQVVGWPVAAAMTEPSLVEKWSGEILLHSSGEAKAGPWYAYLHILPFQLLPWTPLLLLAVPMLWRRKGIADPLGRLLACWFVPGMIVLQLAAHKSSHYVFPMLPAVSVVLALMMALWLQRRYRQRCGMQKPAAVAVFLGVIAAGVAVAMAPIAKGMALALVATVGAGLLLTLWFEQHRRLRGQIVVMFGTVALAIALGNGLAADLRANQQRDDEAFAAAVNSRVPSDQTLYLVAYGADGLFWHLDARLVRLDDVNQLRTVAPVSQGVFAVVRMSALSYLCQHYQVEVLLDSNVEGSPHRPVLVRLRRTTSSPAPTGRAD